MLHRLKETYHKPGDQIKPRKKAPTYQVADKIAGQEQMENQVIDEFLGVAIVPHQPPGIKMVSKSKSKPIQVTMLPVTPDKNLTIIDEEEDGFPSQSPMRVDQGMSHDKVQKNLFGA